MLDLCDLSVQAWEKIEPASIARCLVKARCLARLYETELNQQRQTDTKR